MYTNKDEAIHALKDGEDVSSYKFANLINNEQFVIEATEINKNILHHVDSDLKSKLEPVVLRDCTTTELFEYRRYESRMPDEDGWNFYDSVVDEGKSVTTEILKIVINEKPMLSKEEFINIMNDYGSLLRDGIREYDNEMGQYAVEKKFIPLLKICENKINRDEIKELALLSIENNARVYKWLDSDLKNDKEIVLKTVELQGSRLEDTGNNFKNDKEIVLAAIKQNYYAFEYASPQIKELCQDKDPVETLTKIVETEKLYEQLQKVVPPKGLALARELSNECKQSTVEQSHQVAKPKQRIKI